jgi:hypothetical protein
MRSAMAPQPQRDDMLYEGKEKRVSYYVAILHHLQPSLC